MTPTTTLSAFIDSSPFWSSFLAQLLATFIVAVIGSLLLPPFLRWRQRAKVLLFKTNTKGLKIFNLTESFDKEWEVTLNLSIKNLGTKTLDRFYWEIYVPVQIKAIEFTATPPFPNENKFNKQTGNKYYRYYGYVNTQPIFPLDDIDFPFEIKVKVKERKEIDFYYYFRTDWGDSPKWSILALSFNKHNWLKSLKIK